MELNSLQIHTETATSHISASVWPGGSPDLKQRYDIALEWHKEGGMWRVVSSHGWQNTRPDMLP
ncbi:MAG: hypothetical protein ACLFWB_06030 [Armatimonadota bacterium]